jgi:endonuclease YncB( thermonuclease family)
VTIRKIVCVVLLLIFAVAAVQDVLGAEIERVAAVASVHDGDTFTLTTGEKVRLADLNAPELGDEGADEARDYLNYLVNGETVYLDVDDKYQTDQFGRLVCVVYVDYNSTHYLNVNEALINGGYVEARNYDNEFSYNLFEAYLLKNQPDLPSVENTDWGLIGRLAVFAIFGIIIILMALKKR